MYSLSLRQVRHPLLSYRIYVRILGFGIACINFAVLTSTHRSFMKILNTSVLTELTKLSFHMDTRGFNSVDEKWSCFEDNIHRIMDSCIPSKWTGSRYNLPWFNHSLKRLARRKQRLYNKAKFSGKQNDWKAFLVARKLMHKRLKEARNAYISDYLGEAIEENPKRFWSYVKQLKKEEPGIADFEINGSIISDNKSKAEILNNQFSNVFTQEDL